MSLGPADLAGPYGSRAPYGQRAGSLPQGQSPALAASLRIVQDPLASSGPAPPQDIEQLELRQDLIDRESVLLLQQQKSMLDDVHASVRLKEKEVEELRIANMKGNARLDALEGALARTSARKVVLERELAERESELERLRSLSDQVKRENNDLNYRVNELQAKATQQEDRLVEYSQKQAGLERMLEDQQYRVAELQKLQDASSRENELHRQKARENEEQLAADRLQIARLTRDNEVIAKANLQNEELASGLAAGMRAVAKEALEQAADNARLQQEKAFTSAYLERLLDENIRVRDELDPEGRARRKLRALVLAAAATSRLRALAAEDPDARDPRSAPGLRRQLRRGIARQVDDMTPEMLANLGKDLAARSANAGDSGKPGKSSKGPGVIDTLFARTGVQRPTVPDPRVSRYSSRLHAASSPSLSARAKEVAADLQVLTRTVSTLQKQNGDFQAAITRLQTENSGLSAEAAGLKADLSLAQTDLDHFKQRLTEVTNESTDAKARLQEQLRVSEQLRAENYGLKADLSLKTEENEGNRARVTSLSEALDQREKRITELERDMQRLQSNVRAREAEIESTRRVVDALAAESQQTKKEADEKYRRLRETEIALERERAERAEKARRRMQILENRSQVEEVVSQKIEDIAAPLAPGQQTGSKAASELPPDYGARDVPAQYAPAQYAASYGAPYTAGAYASSGQPAMPQVAASQQRPQYQQSQPQQSQLAHSTLSSQLSQLSQLNQQTSQAPQASQYQPYAPYQIASRTAPQTVPQTVPQPAVTGVQQPTQAPLTTAPPASVQASSLQQMAISSASTNASLGASVGPLGSSSRPPKLASPMIVTRASARMTKDQIRELINTIDKSLVN